MTVDWYSVAQEAQARFIARFAHLDEDAHPGLIAEIREAKRLERQREKQPEYEAACKEIEAALQAGEL